jgi:hypothetical protein
MAVLFRSGDQSSHLALCEPRRLQPVISLLQFDILQRGGYSDFCCFLVTSERIRPCMISTVIQHLLDLSFWDRFFCDRYCEARVLAKSYLKGIDKN